MSGKLHTFFKKSLHGFKTLLHFFNYFYFFKWAYKATGFLITFKNTFHS